MSNTYFIFLFAMFLCAMILSRAAMQKGNGYKEQADTLKKQAVERGYAEWKVDNSGSVKWQWKEARSE